jgi:hypothetical protein
MAQRQMAASDARTAIAPHLDKRRQIRRDPLDGRYKAAQNRFRHARRLADGKNGAGHYLPLWLKNADKAQANILI